MSTAQADLAAFYQKVEAAIEANSNMRRRLVELIGAAKDVNPEYAATALARVAEHISELGRFISEQSQRRH